MILENLDHLFDRDIKDIAAAPESMPPDRFFFPLGFLGHIFSQIQHGRHGCETLGKIVQRSAEGTEAYCVL